MRRWGLRDDEKGEMQRKKTPELGGYNPLGLFREGLSGQVLRAFTAPVPQASGSGMVKIEPAHTGRSVPYSPVTLFCPQ